MIDGFDIREVREVSLSNGSSYPFCTEAEGNVAQSFATISAEWNCIAPRNAGCNRDLTANST